MADAAVSKTVVERRASSTLASGTIPNKKSADRIPGQLIFFSQSMLKPAKAARAFWIVAVISSSCTFA